MRNFTVILFFIVSLLNGQENKKTYSVKGVIKYKINNDTITPSKEIALILNRPNTSNKKAVLNQTTGNISWIINDKKDYLGLQKNLFITNSLGEFHFYNLIKGKYELIFMGLNTSNFNFEIKDKTINNLNIVLELECNYNRINALNDIKNKDIKLLIIRGIIPKHYKQQLEIEKKYHFKYFNFSNDPPNIECILDYNKTIIEYFDKKYGSEWREEIRIDIIGI